MMPADNHVALGDIMTVCPEVTGLELKLDADFPLTVTHTLVSDAVWELGTYYFHPELQFSSNVRKKEDDAEFVAGSVFERSVL